MINFFCNADEKSLFKDIREIVNFNFDADKKLHLFAKEFKKMSKTEMFRKIPGAKTIICLPLAATYKKLLWIPWVQNLQSHVGKGMN